MSTEADFPRNIAQTASVTLPPPVGVTEGFLAASPGSTYFFTTDTELRITGIFGRLPRWTDRNPQELLGRSVEELTPGPPDETRLRAMRLALTGEHQAYDWTGPISDGTEPVIHTSLSHLRDHEGRVTGLVGMSRDVTELASPPGHRVPLGSRIDPFRFECAEMLDALPEVVALINRQGRILRCNRAIESYGAGLPSEAVGQPLHLVLHPLCTDADCYLASSLRQAEGTTIREPAETVETYDRVLDRRIRFRLRPIRQCDGAPADRPLVAVLEDLSEQARVEDQLRQAQKLESIGQLAAGIAHEINTPTQYVGDNLVFLRDSFRDILALLEPLTAIATDGAVFDAALGDQVCRTVRDIDLVFLRDEVPRAIEQAIDGVGRVATIVKAMKAFSHPGPAEPMPVDIHEAIRNTVTVARNRWKYVATLDLEFDPNLPLVPCVPGEFNQVILNLIVNAADAIADAIKGDETRKGVIAIRTRREGDWAEIRVVDSGTGVPEQARGRIFEPFFTTKQIGQGSGQGLALCHAIVVQKHRGTLTFETEDGVGSSFIVRLPLAAPAEAPPAFRRAP